MTLMTAIRAAYVAVMDTSAVMDTAMSDRQLLYLVVHRIELGALPVVFCSEIRAGYGLDSPCTVCTHLIRPGQVMYEIDHPESQDALTFHFRCFVVWQAEAVRRLNHAA